MDEEIEFIIMSAKEAMEKALTHLKKQFINIRAGKASPSMLGSVSVNYYGALTPLSPDFINIRLIIQMMFRVSII